jgi:CBS domain containing-hemolysin-like protein
MDSVLGLLAVFALVFMNGFFVAAEFAFVGARKTRIAQLASEGNQGAVAAQDAIQHLDSYIAATQLGITLASLALGWIGEPAVAHLLEALLHGVLPESVAETASHTISVIVGFSLVTMLHIVLGELAPKSIALQRPEQTSVVVARPTRWFLRIFRPVIYVMNSIGNAVVRLAGFEPVSSHSQVHSAEELEMLVRSSTEAGFLQQSEEQLLRRVFDFSDIHVEAVMQPRVEIDAIAVDTPLREIIEKVSTQHHSRYPVYEESIDKVVGILHAKDLFDVLVKRPELLTNPDASFDIVTVLRDPLFMPTSVSVDKVLEEMQRSKTHFAVIVDEYGGMAGVATMEDILEQLVGEVQDEFDVEEVPIKASGDIAVVDGLVSLDEMIDRFSDPGDEAQSVTIGGYVAERLDRIPVIGDRISFGDYELVVEEMDGMRVSKLRVIRLESPGDRAGQGDVKEV